MKKSILLGLLIMSNVQQIECQEVPLAYTEWKHITYNDDYFASIVPKEFDSLVYNAATESGTPMPILTALIWCESKYDKNAVNLNTNGTWDGGLLQLNSQNYAEFKWRFNNNKDYDVFDPKTNLMIGCKYLMWIYNNKKIGKGKWFDTIVFWNGSKESSKKLARFVLGHR